MFKALKDLNKHQIECPRRDRIEECPYLLVTGNPLNTKQGAGIIVPLGLLEMALILQKRRRLGEKEAKGASSGVLDAVAGVGPFLTMVGSLTHPLV